MTDPAPISLWDASSEEPALDSPMTGDTRCDLAIVGGGFTGLSTALHAAEKGLDCHVLEARSIGFGGSGRNVGLVNAGLWLPPQDVAAKLGEDAGNALVRTMGDMPDYVFDLIEKHQIRCEPARYGTIHAAHSKKGFEDLARRAIGWHRLGVPVELIGAEETAAKTGTEQFFGGLIDHRAGTINPMGYVRGLARAAQAAGATISTGATVQSLARENGSWQLRTPQGTVTAKNVVIATNAYSDDLWPGLRQSYTPIHFFQLATVPLGDRGVQILRGGQGLWDTAPVMFALRRDGAGRLIVGSMGAIHGGASGLSRRWASRMLRRLYPDLGPVEFESAWHGTIAMTPDHIFRIHRLAEGLYAPTGYNGRGITTGTLFGRALAELLTGAPEASLPIPLSDPEPIAFNALKAGAYHTAFAANQFVRSF